MKLCFLVEEQYRYDGMPVEVISQLREWGHHVDVLRPGSSLIRVSDAVRAGSHDAWVLKTVSGGPGLTLLEAAAAVGLTTVNDARSVRGVRDKALAAAVGRSGVCRCRRRTRRLARSSWRRYRTPNSLSS